MAGKVSKNNKKSQLNVSEKGDAIDISGSPNAQSKDLNIESLSGSGVKKTGKNEVELNAKIQLPFAKSAAGKAALAATTAAIGAGLIEQNAADSEIQEAAPTKPSTPPTTPTTPEQPNEENEEETAAETETPVEEKVTQPATQQAPKKHIELVSKEPPKITEANQPKPETSTQQKEQVTTKTETPTEITEIKKTEEQKIPSTVTNRDLEHIGPRGNKKPAASPHGNVATPPLVNPNRVNNEFNSQKLAQPDETASKNNQKENPHIYTEPASEHWTPEDEERHKEQERLREEQEQNEDIAYSKMNALQKSNRKKQQQKLLKELSKKSGKLISSFEKLVLELYFPEIVFKVTGYQHEVSTLAKQLSKKKTIHRRDGLMMMLHEEIFFFDALVLYPELEIGVWREAIIRFQKYWLSWSVELWWWTVIMAIFDWIIVFPIGFLLFGSMINGPGIRLLKRIGKKNHELNDIVDKIRKLAKPKGGDNENYFYHTKSYER